MISALRKYLPLFLSLCLYYLFSITDRSEFWLLLLMYFGVFVNYFSLFKQKEAFSNLEFGIISFLFHAVFFISSPNLSQDVYRFILDGELLANGFSPYANIPNNLYPQSVANQQELIQKIGELSAGNFSSYPPVNQVFFYLPAKLFPGSIFAQITFFRILSVLSGFGVVFFLRKILNHFEKDEQLAWFYLLNPLVIIETTGNLHFEGIMAYFVISFFYFLLKKNIVFAAILFGIGTGIKLTPLLLIPLIFNFLNKKKALVFVAISGIIVLAPFLLFPIAEIQNLISSIQLWINSFEFNAGIYFLLRWIGFQLVGYNLIGIIGKFLAILSVILILFLSFRDKKMTFQQMLQNSVWIYFIYLLLATTIHPWYIIVPFAIGLLTNQRLFLIWTFLIFLSYSYYSIENSTFRTLVLFIEYGILAYIALTESFHNPLSLKNDSLHRY